MTEAFKAIRAWVLAEIGLFLGGILAKIPEAVLGSLLFALPLMWLLNRYVTTIGYWDCSDIIWFGYWVVYGLTPRKRP